MDCVKRLLRERERKKERGRLMNTPGPAKGSQVKLMMMMMTVMMTLILPVADAKRMNVKLGSASGKSEPESEPARDSNCEAAMNSKEMPDKQQKKWGKEERREGGR